MNAIMASLGGRAPPGQNTLTPCEESRSLVEAPGSRAPGPSASRPCRSERQPAYRCRPPPSSPIPEASVPCSRSWLRSKPPLPIATGAHARGPEPAAPRGNGPQAKTCCLSACSWLHFLKCWSLRQTRSGSVTNNVHVRDMVETLAHFHRARAHDGVHGLEAKLNAAGRNDEVL